MRAVICVYNRSSVKNVQTEQTKLYYVLGVEWESDDDFENCAGDDSFDYGELRGGAGNLTMLCLHAWW